ncbi:MAG: AraC family transcriptional regulator [Fusobacterium varium]|uniref:AraC family transcriptional regulator n=1 Tax=Fusobacterium varium TaxID=856 RepID=UPI00241D381C|nr:AraC family transcriptional regulator [Fusobacterium varium]UYI78942.1 MAG: AraC family transcriptional regulator [Fusobacterium varium]
MERIKLLWIMLLEYKKGWGFRSHSHEYYQIFFIISGNEKEYISVGNKKIKLRDNELIFINRNILHEINMIKGKSINFIDIKFDTENEEIISMLNELPENINIRNDKIVDLFHDIKLYWKDESEYTEKIVSLEMELVLSLVLRELKPKNEKEKKEEKLKKLKRHIKLKRENSDEITLKVIDYIEKNYKMGISLNELEKDLNYSKEYLCRCFKKNIDWTIIQYLNYIKIVEAMKLLKNMENSIELVSEILNFSSSQYFSKVFKQVVGITPKDFKKSELQEIILDTLEHGKFDYRYQKGNKKR